MSFYHPYGSGSSGCPHKVILHGLCTECGQDISVAYSSEDLLLQRVSISQGTYELSLTPLEFERLSAETTERLLKQRKLSLVLDLDQTLLHASTAPMISEWILNDPKTYNDIHELKLADHPSIHYVKLRNGIHEFLSFVSEFFECHVYTMGSHSYAQSIMGLIDPNRHYFYDRIIARDSHKNNNWTKKELTRLFPCKESMTVIIDDRSDVWQNSPNLIKIHPYEYFKGDGDIHSPLFNSQILPSQNLDVHPISKELDSRDDQLSNILRVLKSIHSTFYVYYDVKMNKLKEEPGLGETIEDYLMDMILPDEKKKVLDGCHIIFSGIVPLGFDPFNSEIWKLATEFGAACSPDIKQGTTHLIAANISTEKVKRAMKLENIWILKPEWLHESIWKWKKLPETDYVWSESLLPRSHPQSKDNIQSSLETFDETYKCRIEEDDTFLSSLDDGLDSDASQNVETICKKKRKLSDQSSDSYDKENEDDLSDSDISLIDDIEASLME